MSHSNDHEVLRGIARDVRILSFRAGYIPRWIWLPMLFLFLSFGIIAGVAELAAYLNGSIDAHQHQTDAPRNTR